MKKITLVTVLAFITSCAGGHRVNRYPTSLSSDGKFTMNDYEPGTDAYKELTGTLPTPMVDNYLQTMEQNSGKGLSDVKSRLAAQARLIG
ncbi:MAG: hypothetical protein KDD38_09305, partial [Bdellovibrionales bacterium]|nr:hypothetical protein [Bdellovibrionales bacterium]